jgi:hypothetical protein
VCAVAYTDAREPATLHRACDRRQVSP